MTALAHRLALATLGVMTTFPAFANEPLLERFGLGVGAVGIYAPKYEGSDEYSLRGLPIAFPVMRRESGERSRFDFRGIDDIRLTVLRQGGLDVGPVAGYSVGRDEDLSTRLFGLGDVEDGVVVGAFGSYQFEPFYTDIAFRSQVTGLDEPGSLITAGVGTNYDLTPELSLGAYASADYAFDGFMDAYFSVTPAQAAASPNYGAFNADAGFKSVSIDLNARYAFTEQFSVNGSLGYSRLLGDAARSPISETNNQYSVGAGMQYRF